MWDQRRCTAKIPPAGGLRMLWEKKECGSRDPGEEAVVIDVEAQNGTVVMCRERRDLGNH